MTQSQTRRLVSLGLALILAVAFAVSPAAVAADDPKPRDQSQIEQTARAFHAIWAKTTQLIEKAGTVLISDG